MNACSLYWIRASHHSNFMEEGYIGVSLDVNRRWKYGHRWAQKKNRHNNPKLSNAIQKYGWENLVKEVLVIASERYCYDLEEKLRSRTEIGWNIAIGGQKPPISKARGPNYVSPLKGVSRPTPWLVGRAPANAGKPISDEVRAKLSAAHKGRKQTPEQIAKRVAARRATLAAQGRTK